MRKRQDVALQPVQVAVRESHRGKDLARRWGLRVQQALYRRTGDWYHQLTKFPGALLDADGYVIFDNGRLFEDCPQLRVGKDPRRHGGWVSAPLGIKTIPGYANVAAVDSAEERSIVDSLLRARVPARGQTWGGTPEGRRAIELYAMNLAVQHYATSWQEVLDVSANEPFDLLCRDGARELRVEVKGTTSLGLSVLLTRNEVQHAQENISYVALFVVSNVVASVSGCAGGTIHAIEPWDIRDDELEPIAFECRLRERPRPTKKKDADLK